MRTDTIRYKDGDVELEGFCAFKKKKDGARPAVLVAHAWGGLGDLERDKARALAKLGYVGFALDLYGAGKRGSGPEENAKLMQPFLDDRALLRRRMLAALEAARALEVADAKRIGAIGFCFGGLCVLDLARSGADVRGVVSFHGLLGAPDGASKAQIRAKVLVLHGHDDPLVPKEQFDRFTAEMTERGVDWQVHQYGATMHAFTNPNANDRAFGTVYDEKADRRSWIAMKDFFEEVL
jgi:dienelactone hydrolase